MARTKKEWSHKATAASGEGSRKPADITLRLSSTNTGDQPEPDWWTPSPSQPIILQDWCLSSQNENHLGMLGPQRSMSSTPTVKSSLVAKQRAKVAVTVLLPTPPFPERMSTMFLTASRFLVMRSTSGSGAAGPAEAQMDWFGQPAQAAALPLSSVPVPGQASGGGSTKLIVFS